MTENSDDKNVEKKWNVTTEHVKTGEQTTEQFDAVVVANGHYSVPSIPDLPGLEQFQGLQMHSHDYRSPEKFRGMRVVVLGAAASGVYKLCM